MKKNLLAVSLIVSGILAGCAGNQGLVKEMSVSPNVVFQEVKADAPPQPGYVDLSIFSSLKTHKPGVHTASDTHGTGQYRLLVKIDGQAVTLKGDISLEKSPARSMRDPEEGEGVRYLFLKKVRLKGGDHKIEVSLPEEGVASKRELTLPGEGSHELTIEPLYGSIPGRQSPGYVQTRSFKEGVRCLVLILDGVSI